MLFLSCLTAPLPPDTALRQRQPLDKVTVSPAVSFTAAAVSCNAQQSGPNHLGEFSCFSSYRLTLPKTVLCFNSVKVCSRN